jgi:hypothetical protein
VWKGEGIAPTFFTSSLDGCELSVSCNGRIAPGIVFFLVSWDAVRLSPLGTSATNWPIVPAPDDDDDDDDDDDECGAVGEMRIGRGNRSTRRKPAAVPLCSPQIPHDLTWDQTWAAAEGSRRVTA